jgi:uncharacterized protein
MPVTVNLRHLEKKDQHLEGDLPVKELDLMLQDELIKAEEPLEYDLEVTRSGQNLLVNGTVALNLQCECVRCLKPLKHRIELDPYDLAVPLEGEEKAPVDNDLVDLTPYLREDILLAFPQHPVCEAGCDPLPQVLKNNEQSGTSAQERDTKSAWDELNKLKF